MILFINKFLFTEIKANKAAIKATLVNRMEHIGLVLDVLSIERV